VAGGRQLVLDELLKDYDFGDGYVTGGTAGGAPMAVVSELISLPTKAAVVPLVNVVPPFVARCLNTPDAFSLPPSDWPDQRPAGCSMVTDSEWMKLLARLLACGMVVIREEKDDVWAAAYALGVADGTDEHGVGCSYGAKSIPGGITGSLHPNCGSSTKQKPRAIDR
jgi:hypothetical protein